jgi:hypothetical protein
MPQLVIFYFIHTKGITNYKHTILVCNVIIELAHLQSGERDIRVQSKLKRHHVHHEKNIKPKSWIDVPILDTILYMIFNFIKTFNIHHI